MDDLKLTEEEKREVFDFLWENMFDSGQPDEWYLDGPMEKLIKYLGVDIPQEIDVRYSNGSEYTIKIHI